MRILQRGSKGQAVVGLKERLAAQGFWPDHLMGLDFTPKLEDAVAYFQMTHLGPDGKPLAVDGKVGPNTEWALKHPTGKAQTSNISPAGTKTGGPKFNIPDGLSLERYETLMRALGEHGVRERPMGSNRGPGIDKYLPRWWLEKEGKGPAWCCFFVSWVVRQVFGFHPLGRNHGSCKQAWKAAQEREMAYQVHEVDTIVPGDAFYMRWRGGGHIGFIYRVSEDGQEMNTVEGNCGNRVKVGRRSLSDERIFGIIDFYGEEYPDEFERGLIEAKDVAKDGTR